VELTGPYIIVGSWHSSCARIAAYSRAKLARVREEGRLGPPKEDKRDRDTSLSLSLVPRDKRASHSVYKVS